MKNKYLVDLQKEIFPKSMGGKGDKLLFLKKHGYRIPPTLVCNPAVDMPGRDQALSYQESLRLELHQTLDSKKRYAVRSSANVEDSSNNSFAGQFTTQLDVEGVEAVLGAVVKIQSSASSPEVTSYLQRSGLNPDNLSVAVIIQEMVEQVVSGVSFSKNPTTGFDEIVVELVEGSGVQLVQEGVTPERWIYKWGRWLEKPGEDSPWTSLVLQVVNETQKIARIFAAPVDLEWVFDGQKIWWIQLREITTLGKLNVYSNRISREVLPGIIKPLVWSINVPLVNQAWIRLFTELIGPNRLEPADLSKAFYYRAYFNMSAIGIVFDKLGMPRESLELLMGIEAGPDKPGFRPRNLSFRQFLRLLRLIIDKLTFDRKVKTFLPKMKSVYSKFSLQKISEFTDQEILAELKRLYAFNQEAAYYNIVVPLLQSIYATILKRVLGRLDVDFERFDLTRNLDELRAFDPNPHLEELHDLFLSLDREQQNQVRSVNYHEFINTTGIRPLQKSVDNFIKQFGHLSDSGNDFSSIPWRENPDLILRIMVDHTSQDRIKQLSGWEDLVLSGWRRSFVGWIYQRARAFRLHREAVSFYYTYGYGLFRKYFIELGRRLSKRGQIDSPEDIFYLFRNESEEAILATTGNHEMLRTKIKSRKAEIETYRNVILPDIIFGDEQPPLENPELKVLKQFKGTPASRGYYEGPVCVIRSVNEFEKLKSGDVLVIPYSDVSWTPLFAKAGAVIAESGGLLSHSSIVAREYDLPAVVSVTGACQIPDGTIVSIDGYKGHVLIHEIRKSVP